MFSKLNKKNVFVIIIEVLIVIAVLASITYAIYNVSSNVLLRTKKIGIDTDIYGDTTINSDNISLIPINDNEVLDNDNNVLKIDFNVRGSKDNLVNNVIYDVALVDLNVDCELVSRYLKWQLYKNGELLNSGDLSNNFDTIIDNRLVLTDIQQDLVSYNKDPDKYEFVMWISNSDTEEQSNLLNKYISGRLEVELYTGAKKEIVRSPYGNSVCLSNLDKSGANRPDTSDKMIPVYYDNDNNTWKKADILNNNEAYKWYDYDNKMWANIVIVKDYEKYQDIELGSIINNEDIVAFYVWIPRYKYQVWNIDGDNELANNYKDGINISFENGLEDSGNITCSNDKCVGNNSEWLTHPIFTKNNIKGFWIGKYMTSGDENNPLIIDSNNYLNNYTKEKALVTSLKILDYGINNLKLEILNNLEWGAVSYLSYSKYGSYITNSDINIYSVYGINNDSYELIINNDSNILGNSLKEVGKEVINTNVIYRNSLFNYVENIDNYGFRSVLY